MLLSLVLFLIYFGLGISGRLCFKGLIKLYGKIGRPAAITLEFIAATAFGIAFIFIMLFLGEGVFMPFTLFATVIGFVSMSLII